MARIQAGALILRREGSEVHFRLSDDITTLGRSESCTIVIPDPTVSRLHAQIELQHDRYMIDDAKSANGTFLNRTPIAHSQQLSTGDEIWHGSEAVALHFYDPEETTPVALKAAPAPITIDENARTVEVYGLATPLSPLEYGLLVYLAHNPGTVCTREACFAHVWGQPYDHATCEDALNACVAKLRRNLRASAQIGSLPPPRIMTIQRVGFRLDSEVAFAPRAAAPQGLRELEVG
jgi:DNA-binding winged helix-turn-helix (wHTH) protein